MDGWIPYQRRLVSGAANTFGTDVAVTTAVLVLLVTTCKQIVRPPEAHLRNA